MNEPQCKNCQNYIQHYIMWGYGFAKVNCGHCKYPRLKHRKPDTLACVHFQTKPSEA